MLKRFFLQIPKIFDDMLLQIFTELEERGKVDCIKKHELFEKLVWGNYAQWFKTIPHMVK